MKISYKKRKHGVGLKEISIIKKVCYKTAYNNRNKFDVIPNTKPPRYFLNNKLLNWYPEYEKAPRLSLRSRSDREKQSVTERK
jgi:hypothetical protein